MKRYLTYLVLVALSSSVFFTAQSSPEALASTNQQASNKTSQSTSKTDSATKPIAKAAPAVAVAASAPAPVQATPPPFDPNNPATWPTCPDTQIVWAQDGQCHDKVVAAPVAVAAASSYSAPAPVADTGGCVTGYATGDYYLDKIIAYESGGRSCATNPGGCFGLLQACPGEPLRAACGGSPSCQIEWFQANKTGGRSWAQVWQHELDYGWW